ncbi:MAG TPA: hypothetical protein VGM39_15635 [Kofleriaceae bacterium]
MPTVTKRIKFVGVWDEIEAVVADELGALLGTNFVPVTHDCEQPTYTSVISLTFTNDRLMIQLGIGIDERGRSHLQQILLGGDGSDEVLRDALREMANTAGGAISRKGLQEGRDIALGLPSNDNEFTEASGKRRAWHMTNGEGLRIECVASARKSDPYLVPASALVEGMVVVAVLNDAKGKMLAAPGTRVTTGLARTITAAICDEPVLVSRE